MRGASEHLTEGRWRRGARGCGRCWPSALAAVSLGGGAETCSVEGPGLDQGTDHEAGAGKLPRPRDLPLEGTTPEILGSQ